MRPVRFAAGVRDFGAQLALAVRNFVFWESLGISRGESVLDIGSGHNPRYFADVICERYVDDDTGRPGSIVADDRLVVGDIHALPFANDSFDFAICNHVLEHVSRPLEALLELSRVAKRGLLVTPSILHQSLHGADNPEHRWLVEVDQQGALLLHPKSDTDSDRAISVLMRQMRDESFLYRFLLGYRPAAFEVRYRWTGPIRARVTGAASATAVPQMDAMDLSRWQSVLQRPVPLSFRGAARRVYRRIRYGPTKPWAGYIACPQCHGPVSVSAERISCSSCRVDYPVVSGRPVMLVEAARSHPTTPLLP